MSAPRFNASILFGHQLVLSNVMGRLQLGNVFALTPDEYRQLSDLAGALNYWSAQVPAYQVHIQPEIAAGDFSRKTFMASREIVTAFPFRVPAGPFTGPNGPLLRMSCAEFGGDPWLRTLAVSAVAGDMTGQPQTTGKEAGLGGSVGIEFAPGALLYANILLMEEPRQDSAGSSFSIIWPQQ